MSPQQTAIDSRSSPATAGRFLVVLIGVVAVLAGVRALLSGDAAQRNLEFMPEMVTSPAVESQSVALALPGGISHQPLVAGVVPRGALPFRYELGEADAARAGRELSSPLAAGDKAAAARGARVYAVHCAPCHDATGGGQGPAVMRGMLPPPQLLGANALQMPDGQMFHLLTLGRGNMPAMGGRIAASDRWAAILHVRALQSPPPESAARDATQPGPEVPGDKEDGR